MKNIIFNILLVFFVICFTGNGLAHFGVIMPSDDIVSQKDPKKITLQVKFMHPFEWHYMDMGKPKRFEVIIGEGKQDLLQDLKSKKIKGFTIWESTYTIKEPGSYIFYVEPAPYWEQAEEKFIVHYTKVIVNALGKEDGWDKEIGIKTEIVPLTRPFGLWSGNIFRGIVKVDGKPVSYSDVEVEYYNPNSKIKAPEEPFVTQIIKTDSNGVFSYAMPKAGWWGFSAINNADYTLKHNGKEYPVEIGAVLWVKTREMR